MVMKDSKTLTSPPNVYNSPAHHEYFSTYASKSNPPPLPSVKVIPTPAYPSPSSSTLHIPIDRPQNNGVFYSPTHLSNNNTQNSHYFRN